ncbi:unnamed protein product [Meganyctiphanes norvegica]|uniref:Hormone receptor 4 n=1 Tax=Meganyctiphanes norvegica TaxID=48144 RepID=A0AAV2R2N9_MEGNR
MILPGGGSTAPHQSAGPCMVNMRAERPHQSAAMLTPGIMTVTLLQCEGVKMSLFQDLKLKRRKVDSRCSSDGESLAESSSCSPDSGSLGREPSCSPQEAGQHYQPSVSRQSSPILHHQTILNERSSPDSAGNEYGDVKSSADFVKIENTQEARIYDGGGEHPVSSTAPPRPSNTPFGIVSGHHYEDREIPEQMSTTPPPPDTSERLQEPPSVHASLPPQFVGLRAPINVASMASIGAITSTPYTLAATMAALSPANVVTVNSSRNGFPVPTSMSQYWNSGGNRIHGVKPEIISGGIVPPTSSAHTVTVQADSSRSGFNNTQRLRTPTVIMGEAGGVKTMFWTSPNNEATPQTSISQVPREVLSPPTHSYGADTSDAAVRASVDGLLALGRGSSPQLSPTTTNSMSPSARSPQNHNSRSPLYQTQFSRSPYTIAPSSPGFAQVARSMSSPMPSPNEIQFLHNSPYMNTTDSHRQQGHHLNMERLWAGDRSQLPSSQADSSATMGLWGQRNGETTIPSTPNVLMEDEDDTPMICMICEDRATGLHYGIITCEGCKGFFKRTVQNKRVYTCVADGNCEITKAQRNRCQYCRFQKCINQGMVLAAVREDRMPGGRNSGAVYNLYKVKYKKKKNKSNGQVKPGSMSPENRKFGLDPLMMGATTPLSTSSFPVNLPSPIPTPPVVNSPIPSPIGSNIISGHILKAALTNPAEVAHFRHRMDNNVTSTRERRMPYPQVQAMIRNLIDCDNFEDIATLKNLDDLLDHKSDLSTKLCQLGDSISIKLVQWTKRLPFYEELPVEVHTRILTHKWHELLVLTTSAYQAIYGHRKLGSRSSDGTEAEFHQEVSNNLCTLQTCLNSMMGRPITMDQLRMEVGVMVEKITHVTLALRKLKVQIEEYVCLKVIAMLNTARNTHKELEVIQERYMNCLRTFCETHYPAQPTRYQELLVRLPDIQAAAAKLLETKMLYVPFLLNATINR